MVLSNAELQTLGIHDSLSPLTDKDTAATTTSGQLFVSTNGGRPEDGGGIR
tara:strand:+ start:231 stop:383 length:153 start_codon:yes stop_codon:yes gene_type:complete